MSRRSPTRGSSGCSSLRPPFAAVAAGGRRAGRAPRRARGARVRRRDGDRGRWRRRRSRSPRSPTASPRSQRACATAGVAPGDRVALLAPDPPDFIAAAYACWAIGAVAVVVDRGLGFKGLRRALRSAEPRWLVGTRKTLGAARALRWAPDARPLELASLSGSGAKLSDVVERHAPARRRARRGRLHLGSDRPGEGRALRPADDGGAVHRRARVLLDRRRRSPRRRLRAVRALRAGARDPGRRAGLRHHEARLAPGRGARRCLRRRRGDDRLRRAGGARRRAGVAGDADRRGEEGARRAPARPLGRRAGAAAHARGVRPSRSGRRAAHALRHDRGALGGRHRPRDARARRAGARGVRRAAARGRRAPDRAAARAATASAARSSSARRGCRSATTGSGRPTIAPGPSTRTGWSGIARATSGTSTTPGGSGSRDGSRTSSRRPTAR